LIFTNGLKILQAGRRIPWNPKDGTDFGSRFGPYSRRICPTQPSLESLCPPGELPLLRLSEEVRAVIHDGRGQDFGRAQAFPSSGESGGLSPWQTGPGGTDAGDGLHDHESRKPPEDLGKPHNCRWKMSSDSALHFSLQDVLVGSGKESVFLLHGDKRKTIAKASILFLRRVGMMLKRLEVIVDGMIHGALITSSVFEKHREIQEQAQEAV